MQGEWKVPMRLQEVLWTYTCTVMEVESGSRSPILMPSVCKLSQQVAISCGWTRKVLKKHLKLQPYKITSVHELKEYDNFKHMQYCRWFQGFLTANGKDILDITFLMMKHGSIYQGTWTLKTAMCGQELIYMQLRRHCVISQSWVIGPIFFENTIDPEHYHDMILYPFIGQLTEDRIACAHFQQDSATVHTAFVSMALLCNLFGDQLISRDIWPPRPPDLTLLNFKCGEQWEVLSTKTVIIVFVI